MHQDVETFVEQTRGQGFYELTDRIVSWVRTRDISTGLLTLFCRHTSASLTITENASPAVRADAMRFLARLAPEEVAYEHADEGPDDMPAHLRALVTQTSLSIPIVGRRPALGTWQGVYLVEHRARPMQRHVVAHVLGT